MFSEKGRDVFFFPSPEIIPLPEQALYYKDYKTVTSSVKNQAGYPTP